MTQSVQIVDNRDRPAKRVVTDGGEDDGPDEDDPIAVGGALLVVMGFLYVVWRILIGLIGHFTETPVMLLGKLVVIVVGGTVGFVVVSWLLGTIVLFVKSQARPWVGGDDE